jgi:hypothetical protein
MDISHHASTTTPAVAVPFSPLAPQPKGLGEQFMQNQNAIRSRDVAYTISEQNEPMAQRTSVVRLKYV